MAQVKAKIVEEYGPYGSQETPTFRLVLDRADTVRAVSVRAGDIVDGIGFAITAKGEAQTTWFGGNGGNLHSIIMKEGEHVTQISGEHGVWTDNHRHIISMKIHTNNNPLGYGPFGLAKDCKKIEFFETPGPSVGPVVGFLGASGQYLNSIGVYIEKFPNSN